MMLKAKSTYGMSPNDLKELEPYIIEPLVDIFNEPLQIGEFPNPWLWSKIFFFYKHGDKNLPSNYRTINIQNGILKLYSKANTQRFHKFLEENKMLHPSQFGYRKTLSTRNSS